MGDLISSIENELIDIIRQDLMEKMKNIIIKNNLNKDILIGPHKRTLIQLCSYYGSIKCLEELINLNFNINQLETSNYNSPLFIACKFNFIEIVFLLLNNKKQKCIIMRKNIDGLNEFEVAFLRGNYEICYYLLYEYNYEKDKSNNNEYIQTNENEYLKYFNDINFSLEKYLGMQEVLLYPIFNMPLFYHSLRQKINPEKCPSFAPEKKKTNDLLTKIPDPNESWSNFIKRLTRLELYNPPLVDKNTISRANSLYMKSQMKIISMEYGIPMDYCQPKELNLNKNEEEIKPLNFIDKDEKINNENKNIYDNKDKNNNKQKDKKYFKINMRNNFNKLNTGSQDPLQEKNKNNKDY